MRLARARLAIEDAIVHLRALDDDVTWQGVDLESIRVRLTLLEDRLLELMAENDWCPVCEAGLKAGYGAKRLRRGHKKDCLMRSRLR